MTTREALLKYVELRKMDVDWDQRLDVVAAAALKVAACLDDSPASSTAANLGRELRSLMALLAAPDGDGPDMFDILQAELRKPA
jgi:hypothetical protein